MSAVLRTDGTATPARIPEPVRAAVPERAATVGIGVHGLHKRYGSFAALDDVSLDVRPGEFLTLLGPSGSGKTTLLNIVAGFVRPDAGQLCFGTQDVTLLPVHLRELGMVFQNYALFPHMSVAENVAFPLRVRRLPAAQVAERVARALALVKLEPLGERRVSQLSGGQRQRVALARAVVFSPRIVLMDEPLSALDKNLREQMQVEIRQLHERIGATTIYVTHDQREALTLSDRIAVMHQGRIVQCDEPRQIYEQPVNGFVAGFIGETTLVEVQRAAHGVCLADGTMLRPAGAVPERSRLLLVLRAERLLLPDECPQDANRIAAVVRNVIYQGDSILLIAELAGGPQVAVRRPLRGAPGALPRAGEMLQLGIARAATLLVPA